jgi:DNA modification methylase
MGGRCRGRESGEREVTPYYEQGDLTIYNADCLEALRQMPDESVNCCVTSPPYWGLRDYGVDGQIGLEETPDQYVAKMVAVFREVRRVLRDDGTLWLNLGDTYAGYHGNKPFSGTKLMTDYVGDDGKPYIASPDCPIHGHLARSRKTYTAGYGEQPDRPLPHSRDNDADRASSRAVWQDATTCHSSLDVSDANARPRTLGSIDECRNEADRHESTLGERSLSRTNRTSELHGAQDCKTDSLGRSHAEIATEHSNQMSRIDLAHPTSQHGNASAQTGAYTQRMSLFDELSGQRPDTDESNTSAGDCGDNPNNQSPGHTVGNGTSQAFSVASVTSTDKYTCTCRICKVAHFATFPPKLIEPCIKAGCPAGGVVLDPFFGAGTTGLVARQLGCKCIGIELNPKYCDIAVTRLAQGVLPFAAANLEGSVR